MEVPDTRVAEKFYSAFGLAATHSGTAVELRASGASAANIVVLKGGSQKRLHYLSFAIRPGDLGQFEEHLRRHAVTAVTPPFGTLRPGLWFQDPWGTWVNLVPLPARATAAAPKPAPAGP